MISGNEALERLRSGNARYVDGDVDSLVTDVASRREALVAGQNPFAIILGCSDSRVPAEIVFHQSLGDLFVIRVAGNVVAPSQIGSVEFAAAQFGTPLVVVLGHSHCGAIAATVDELERPVENRSPNLRSIVSRILPAVKPLVEADPEANRDRLIEQAVRANIRASVNQLQHGSELLESLVNAGTLTVVGAEYCLASGKVDFLTD